MAEFPGSSATWSFILTVAMFVNMAIFAFIPEHKHSMIPFSVENATLTHFNYTTTTNTLRYNLTLNVIVPDELLSLDYINATASYQNVTFASQPVVTLDDDDGSTGLSMHFEGEHATALATHQLLGLDEDNASGVYHINVKLCSKLIKPMVFRCDLQVPLSSRVLCDWSSDY